MFEYLQEHEKTFKALIAIVFIAVLAILTFVVVKKEKEDNSNKRIKKLVTIAIFSTVSFVLYFIKIPFPVFTFLDIQLSNLPAYIIGFLLGPYSGLMVVVIRTILKLPASSTLYVGEIADFLIGTISVVISSLIYHNNKSKKKAIISLVFASFAWVITALILNWLVLLPMYMQLYFDTSVDKFVTIFNLSEYFKNINESNYMLYYLFAGVLPFNILLTALCSTITFLTYKKISKFYNHHEIVYEEDSK